MAMSLQQLVDQINAASKAYNVSPWILLGVFGKETTFGSDVTTSSAGAVGLTQFLPSTAAKYGYPLTNNPTPAQAQQQFNATAHYLSDLYHQTGSWDKAIRSYSGGGYGLADVQSEAKQALGGSGAASFFGGMSGVPGLGSVQVPGAGTVTNAYNAVANAASGAGGVLSTIASGIQALFTASTWLTVLKFLGGAILLFIGIKALAGVDIPGPPV